MKADRQAVVALCVQHARQLGLTCARQMQAIADLAPLYNYAGRQVLRDNGYGLIVRSWRSVLGSCF
jgi:hypothetical protein